MSLGVVLDVVIGLVFTYLLLALLASGVLELISGAVKLRGRHLRDALGCLLADANTAAGARSPLFDRVWGHALVHGPNRAGLPSYLPARNVALAVIDALMDGSQATLFTQCENTIARLPAGSARDALATLLVHAGGDLDKLRASIETWYDDVMDRLSGDYKRLSHYCLLGLGVVFAVGMNVDSIRIANTLWRDENLRAAVVQRAQDFGASNPANAAGPDNVDLAALKRTLADLRLPMGWADTGDQFKRGNAVWAVIGWVLTAFAVSLGAPFWFDALNRLLRMRQAGAKPPRADAAN